MKLYTSEKSFLEQGTEIGKDYYILKDEPLPEDILTERAIASSERYIGKKTPQFIRLNLVNLIGFGLFNQHIVTFSSDDYDEFGLSPIHIFELYYKPNDLNPIVLYPFNGRLFNESETFIFYTEQGEYDFHDSIATYISFKEPYETSFIDLLKSSEFSDLYITYTLMEY
ncbi:hypothetical protein [Pseudomonas lundensis]|uniref:hypothetical protein n=1 Tax=Pseudomonas lundensis TaxID=86185 RepID=UPI000BA2415C|nr:hypothetical protein [Pseudomonas lundensis]OZY31715.1 hypothetical protein CJF36_16190 [Pseudomonas lundensis]